ncbi:hypothetical protein [Azospirillum doebereinerae]|nr:hypothetical protein [Azospirillum doebereinerae]
MIEACCIGTLKTATPTGAAGATPVLRNSPTDSRAAGKLPL